MMNDDKSFSLHNLHSFFAHSLSIMRFIFSMSRYGEKHLKEGGVLGLNVTSRVSVKFEDDSLFSFESFLKFSCFESKLNMFY